MAKALRQTSNFLQRFGKRFHEARQAKAQRIINEHLRFIVSAGLEYAPSNKTRYQAWAEVSSVFRRTLVHSSNTPVTAGAAGRRT